MTKIRNIAIHGKGGIDKSTTSSNYLFKGIKKYAQSSGALFSGVIGNSINIPIHELKDRSFLALLASSLEKFISPEFGAAVHLSVSLPSLDRLILERSYAGFGRGLTLTEYTEPDCGASIEEPPIFS